MRETANGCVDSRWSSGGGVRGSGADMLATVEKEHSQSVLARRLSGSYGTAVFAGGCLQSIGEEVVVLAGPRCPQEDLSPFLKYGYAAAHSVAPP